MNRGKIIVIEGTDASGKETQAVNLYNKLLAEKFPCEYMSFPRYSTPTGDIVKRYLGKAPYAQEFGPSNEVNPRLASVLYALDRFFAAPEIRGMQSRGVNIVLNRYVESNMGHQGGKIRDASARAEFINWLDELEYGKLNLPKPNLVMFLYMPHQVAFELKAKRGGEADGHESNPEHLLNAEQAYLELAGRYRWRRVNCAPDDTIKSLRSVEDISEEIYRNVIPILKG